MKKTLFLIMIIVQVVAATAQITDLPLTAASTSVPIGSGTQITTTDSQIGYSYFLRDSDYTIIDGPIMGTGNDLTFNTGSITENTSYNVYASNNYALNLTNGNDYVNFGTQDRSIDKEISIAAWIKSSPSSDIRNIVIDYGVGDNGYILRLDNQGRAHIAGRDGTNTYKTSGVSSGTVANNQWHYLVGTINLNTGLWSIYVDGVLANSQLNGVGNTLANFSGLNIGNAFSTSVAISGEVRDVTLWDTELSASQIIANMSTCLTGSEANVVGHFPLSEGAGNTIIDYSSFATNGAGQFSDTGWVLSSSMCRGDLQMSQIIDIVALLDFVDYPITVAQNDLMVGENTDITLTGSQVGVSYYLRAGTTIIDGPIAGTGDDLTFNTGALSASTTFNVYGVKNNAISIQSNQGYIDLTSHQRGIDKEVTISSWVKTNNNSEIRNIVLDYGSNDAGFILRVDENGRVQMSGRDGTGDYKTSGVSSSSIVDNEWHHIVGTINLNTGLWSIYVDGALENAASFAVGNSLGNNDNLYIGHSFSSSRSFRGDIMNVTIWDKELSATEVANLNSNCPTGTEDNIVGHFPIDEGFGINIFDQSDLFINGTAVLFGDNGWTTGPETCRPFFQMSQTATINVSSPIILVNSINVQGEGGASTITTMGGTLQMYANVLPANATDGSVTWSGALGTGSATISSTGLLTAVSDGTVIITATANDASGLSDSQLITISNQMQDIYVSSIDVHGENGATFITTPGGTLQMEATVLPANATDGTYTWSVPNGNNIASISATGLLTAIADGAVTVVATANDAAGIGGSRTITITNQTVDVDDILQTKLNVYPNPTQNELFIDLEKEKMTSLEIIDYTGKVIQTISEGVNSINVSNLSSGIYMLQIKTNNGVYSTTFIKG